MQWTPSPLLHPIHCGGDGMMDLPLQLRFSVVSSWLPRVCPRGYPGYGHGCTPSATPTPSHRSDICITPTNTHTHIYTCIHAYIRMCTHIQTHISHNIRMYTHTHTVAHITHTYIHTCTYIHIHTHTHHTHTHHTLA